MEYGSEPITLLTRINLRIHFTLTMNIFINAILWAKLGSLIRLTAPAPTQDTLS